MNLRQSYWDQILIHGVLSIALLTFYLLWDNPIVGLIVSLILFFIILGRDEIHRFKNLAQFRPRYLWYLLPVFLEWVIALPIQFRMLGGTNWDAITNASSKALLSSVFTQLLLNIREEVTTSFCWLMIAFLVMRLLKVKALKETQLKFTIVVLSIFFALTHYPNAISIASRPALDSSTRIIGAAFVFINIFITGMFFKTVYIKTRSFQTCVLAHFICGLRRAFFPITGPQVDLMTLEQIGYEALVLVIYIVAIIVLWRKQWPLKELNEVYATMDADSTKIQA
jgi:hypothetical protein